MQRSLSLREINELLDKCLFILNAEQHEGFVNALDNPSPPNVELKKLLQRQLSHRLIYPCP